MRKARRYLWIFAILLFQMFVNYCILSRSEVARECDEKNRILGGFYASDVILSQPAWTWKERIDFFLATDQGNAHPRFFELIAAVSLKIMDGLGFRDETAMIFLANSVFLAVLLFSVYGIGARLYGEHLGILAAFVVSMIPVVFGQSRAAMLDFPLAGMVSLFIFFLLKTEGLTSFSYSIAAGVIFFLAQWTKETAIIFIAAPLGYHAVRSLRESRERARVFLNLAVIFFFAAAALGGYLAGEHHRMMPVFPAKAFVRAGHSYFLGLMKMAGPFLAASALPLAASVLWNIKKREKLLCLWFFCPLIFLSLFPNKTYRFIMPVFPAAALLAAGEMGLADFLRAFRSKFIALFVALLTLQYALFNLGFLDMAEGHDPNVMGLLSVKNEKEMLAVSRLSEVFKKEGEDGAVARPPKKILFLFSFPKIQGPFEYKLAVRRLPFFVFCPLEADETDARILYAGTDWEKEVASADYIVDGPDDLRYLDIHGKRREEIRAALRSVFDASRERFGAIAQIRISGGAVITVYKHDGVRPGI